MDASETFIKMCEKAEEIQSLWKPQSGDFLVLRGCDFVDIASDKYSKVKEFGDIWLPRQDELQEMVYQNPIPLGLVHQISGYCELNADYSRRFTSMEQLWLAFVMGKKYSKVWNGEDWVKE